MPRSLVLFALLAACSTTDPDEPDGDTTALPLPEMGTLRICLGGDVDPTYTGADFDLTLDGTVIGIAGVVDDWLDYCPEDPAQTVQIEAADGSVAVLGLTVLDDAGADITPTLDLEVGAEVSLTYRHRMPWGFTSGLVLTDAGGLVAAGDQGSFGNALNSDDVAGLTVAPGDEMVAWEETHCQPFEGFALSFDGDDSVQLVPVDSAPVTVAGAALTAWAIDAHGLGESATCSVSDSSDVYSWLVVR